MQFRLENGRLQYDHVAVFDNLSENIALSSIFDDSVFVNVTTEEAFYEKSFNIGTMPGIEAFELCYRTPTSCWMEPLVGKMVEEMPGEIQYLMVKCGDVYFAFFALVDGALRACFEGGKDGVLRLNVTSGDSQTTAQSMCGFYIGAGKNPYRVIEKAAQEIQTKLRSFRLRAEKALPKFMEYIGWCTYNAFYDKFTDKKLTDVLRNFTEHGFHPGFILLDDGWQSKSIMGRNMVAFEENRNKFPRGLKGFIAQAKKDFGVCDVLMWHTYAGWWAGVKKKKFSQYGTYSPAIYLSERYRNQLQSDEADAATVGKSFYPQFMVEMPVGLPDELAAFYDDFYAYLKAQGVTGTKLDAMTWVEIMGEGTGGRVAMMRKLNHALETASQNHFNGQLINCSSCSNDMVFQSMDTNIIRSSCDYFPEKPETHGKHVFINAHTSLWLGEFLMPDWDMFQSGNTAGDFHAAARAISGGPVYVTDTLDQENYAILQKLCYADGRLPMCRGYAKVCLDSLFIDNQQREQAIKIFNSNFYGGVIGAFNCAYDADQHPTVTARVSPSDMDDWDGERFAVYEHQSGRLSHVGFNEAIEVELEEFGFEIFTIMPIKNGFAPIGLVNKYNSGATIEDVQYDGTRVTLRLGESGDFLAYCDRPLLNVTTQDRMVPFDLSGSRLMIEQAPEEFTLKWG